MGRLPPVSFECSRRCSSHSSYNSTSGRLDRRSKVNLYPSSNPAHVWQRTDAARFTGVRFLGFIEPDLVAKPRYFLTPCSVVVASPCAGSSGYGRPSGDDLLTFGYILWYDNTCRYITDVSGGRRTPEGRRTPNRTLRGGSASRASRTGEKIQVTTFRGYKRLGRARPGGIGGERRPHPRDSFLCVCNAIE